VPDRREIAGGSGVFSIAKRGLAADAGGVGDGDAEKKLTVENQKRGFHHRVTETQRRGGRETRKKITQRRRVR
jgi:hypothetical protein